jgi:hypothetical protein
VSAPVRDASGQVVAVMSVSAPTMRMRPPRPRALLPMVLDAALKLSRMLGGAGPESPGKTNDAARKGAAAGSESNTLAQTLASPGPHSIFR